MSELPAELRLAVGQEVVVELPGLGTAGYLWEAEVVGDEGIVEVAVRHGAGEPEPRTAGRSSVERVVVSGLAAGEVVLRLRQARPWQPGPGRRQESVPVIVRAKD